MSPEIREEIQEELGVALVACSLKGWRRTQEDTSAVSPNGKPRLRPEVVGWLVGYPQFLAIPITRFSTISGKV